MAIDPIPRVPISRIIGLLEVIDDGGGRYDVFRLTRDINYEFGEMLQVIKAAELLDLVVTPGADVVLTGNGSALLRAKVNARKKLLKEQLKRLPLFKTVVEVLQRSEDRRADEDTFLDIFALHLPAEDSEALLKTVIDWGRYTELIGYSPDDQQLYLDQAE
ncbi:MAG TPA: AAA-associated domain-containing protein [Candidatus Udaeobacter sp.]|jgi:NitT/TauT family transport system ATP-binding protein|nr:AAA-associated domain-containing protein [Candidatus Udaeobacter sp.]